MEKLTRNISFIFIFGIISIISHNLLQLLLKKDELVFLLTAIIIFLLLLPLLFGYSIILYSIKKKPKDLWKLGFLGIGGIMGVIPGLYNVYVLFVLFGFFGLKKH